MQRGLDYLLDVLLPLPPPLGLPVVEGHPAPLGLLEGCPRPIAWILVKDSHKCTKQERHEFTKLES